jgi:cyclophilin family peptidyl-prolyl cis-trans isomerase
MKRLFLALFCVALLVGSASAADKNPIVVVDTSLGSFKMELYPDKAPKTVKNFLDYVDDKFYDGTVFHRIIPTFMIQGGGYEKGMKEKKTKEPIQNESDNGLSNTRGSVAMARTNEPNSATAQFYVNVKDNDFLDRAKARDRVGYCVFGKVIEGMEVVDKIKDVKTGANDIPSEDVVIKSIRRVESK